MPTAVPPAASKRVVVYDGLRGIAIVLVVLSHGWTLWPTTTIEKSATLEALFKSGNYAVTIFFVVGAFLATRSLLAKAARTREADALRPAPGPDELPTRAAPVAGGLYPGVELLRRFIRLSGQVYVLVLAVALVTALDATDTYPEKETRASLIRVMTYTWNWYVRDHALEARSDLGHLWYLSVEMQVFVLILLVVYLMRRRPGWLLVTLATLLVATFFWRHHLYETEGVYQALLRTTVRMDAPLTGAVAAAALPWLKGLAPYARVIAALAVVSLVPLLYYNVDEAGFFGAPGVGLDLALGLFMVCTTLVPASRWVTVPLGVRPLAFLGRHSLALYLWHYPVFWFVSRHTIDWSWQARTLLAMSITLVIAIASETLVESRVQRLLRSEVWRDLERGVPAFVRSQVGRRRRRTDTAA